MKSRFAHVLSRLSIVSVVAATALGAAACNRAASTDATATAAAAETQAAPAGEASAEHGPGYHVFRQIESLDLRPAQASAVAELEQNLRADLAPHRETVRQVAQTLAAGVETGRIDPQESAAQQAALVATLTDMRASIASALNEAHDTLDAAQRAQLVAQLRAQHADHARMHAGQEEGAQKAHGPLARLALELSLSEEQRQAIHDAFQKGTDEIFPDRKARREAWEAKMKALGDAFVTDDFDAADFDLATGAEDGIKAFGEVSARAIDLSGSVLSDGQRKSLAAMIRTHAEKI